MAARRICQPPQVSHRRRARCPGCALISRECEGLKPRDSVIYQRPHYKHLAKLVPSVFAQLTAGIFLIFIFVSCSLQIKTLCCVALKQEGKKERKNWNSELGQRHS